jgi:hypothetical protein
MSREWRKRKGQIKGEKRDKEQSQKTIVLKN